jgi:DNA-binding NtrC family response regulator
VNYYLSHEEAEDSGLELLGRSKAMEDLRQLIRKVARTQATVLISGESGTGKELVARALFRQSPRAEAPFIKVNCAAIPENLIESEFFGHEKGAFTGALTKRAGRFELAHGGTILLDEISEISPQVQAKLLRVLQERELERVGGNRTIKVDVRVLATTNRRLEESVERKEFRQDLFFRLNVVPITVPPLRERMEDIPLLAEQFVRRFARKHGVPVSGMSSTCLAAMQKHYWPGNVRELQNVIERAVILCGEGGELEMSHLGFAPAESAVLMMVPFQVPVDEVVGGATPIAASPAIIGASEPYATPVETVGSPLPTAPSVLSVDVPPPSKVPAEENGELLPLAELEKRQILLALDRCKGNRTHAALKLGINVRTLRNKLHEYCGANSPDGEPALKD